MDSGCVQLCVWVCVMTIADDDARRLYVRAEAPFVRLS